MAKINLKQIIHDIKDAYLSASKDTEPVTYGNISDKIANMSGSSEAVGIAKSAVQSFDEVMPITVTVVKE